LSFGSIKHRLHSFMITPMRTGPCGGKATAAVLALVLAAVSACTGTQRFDTEPQQTAAPPATPPAPPPQQPPPIDLAGKWKLSMAGSSACLMTFAATPGASEGSIAPAGGCPGNFFTSRKWTYEHDTLIIHDHKGEVLVQLSFSAGRFDGQAVGGGATTLARP
jgi:Protease inhibitor Inh